MATVLLLAGQLLSCVYTGVPVYAETTGGEVSEAVVADTELFVGDIQGTRDDTVVVSEDAQTAMEEAGAVSDDVKSPAEAAGTILDGVNAVDEDTVTAPDDLLTDTSLSDEDLETIVEYPEPDAEVSGMDAEGLIEEMDPLESAESTAPVSNLTVYLEETITIDDPVVAKGSTSTQGSRKMLRSLRSTASEDTFTGLFYDQLDATARIFYNLRYQKFATERQTSAVTTTYTRKTQIYRFAIDNSFVEITDGKAGITDAAALRLTDAYREGYESLLYELRASFDALCFDHPEIFWTRSTNVSIGFGLDQDEEGNYYLYLSKLTLTPVEAFSGASGLLDAFDAGVAAAVEQIRASCDYDEDGTASNMELLQAIHDYICEICYYDYDGLRAYQQTEESTTDYHIFTPCGAFVESVGSGVVCEGFSKAFKVLCDRFDIPCILILGYQSASSTLAHEWNAVLADGEWFLVDLTNDDSRAGYNNERKYTYFMCPDISGRIYTTQLGGGDKTDNSTYHWVTRAKIFFYPQIADGSHTFTAQDPEGTACEHYIKYVCNEDPQVCFWLIKEHSFSKVQDKIEASCEEAGSEAVYACASCGAQTGGEVIPAAGHTFGQTIEKVEATCTEDGKEAGRICEVCGHTEGLEIIPSPGHQFKEIERKEPTCKEDGQEAGRICEVCGYSEGLETIAATGHHFQNGICSGCGAYDLSKAQIDHINKQSFYYGPVTPAVKVHVGNRTLKEGRDFKVEYVSNTKVGYAKAVVSPLGDNIGTTSITFRIVPKPVEIKRVKALNSGKLKVVWKRIKDITKYQIQISRKRNFSGSSMYRAGSGVKTRNIGGLKHGRTYYVRIRAYKTVGGKRFHGYWSPAVKVKTK